MAELTPPVFLQAGGESAQTSRLAIGSAILSSGIVNPVDLTVTAPGGTMTVSVAAGQGWVVGSRTSQGGYHVVNDAPKTLTIAASDPTNPRFDRIVAQINDAAYSGAVNSFVIAVVQGTASSSPVEPAIPADSFELARVSVAAAATTISSGNILDRRLRAVQRGGVFSPASVADPALSLVGLSGQTGSLQEWKVFGSAAPTSYISATGRTIGAALPINFMFRGSTQTNQFQDFIAPYSFTLLGHRARINTAGILIPQVFKNGSALSAGTQNVTSAGQVDTYGPNSFVAGDLLRVQVISQSDATQSDLVVTMNAYTA